MAPDHGEIREFMGRIDERTKDILDRLSDGSNRMALIERRQSTRPCEKNSERLSQLERGVYGIIATISVFIGSWVWGTITGGKP